MQQLIGEPPGRITPVDETVNVFEVETTAQRKLNSLTFAQITGSDRRVFDRMTFRPRMMIDTTKLDLTLNLFGATMLTPIIAGPVSLQKRFHPEGEVASARGLSAAKVLMVVSDNSSFPLDQIAPEAKAGFWYQVSNDGPDTKVESQKERIPERRSRGMQGGLPDPEQQRYGLEIDRRAPAGANRSVGFERHYECRRCEGCRKP